MAVTLASVDTIGPYEILEEIARGGMGVVYRARDPGLDREVALKVVAGDVSKGTFRQRFQREAQTLARLRHPNVVAIHSAGEHEGQPYLVMALIHGESLEDRLERAGPLPLREAVTIARDLALALHEAHQQAVLHRDLKPGNVLLDREGRTLLTDFGLAKDLDPGIADSLTRSGRFLGTIGFASPEQILGQKSRLGPHSDIYGLGATTYAMLTGRPPIVAESYMDLVEQLGMVIPPPSGHRPEVDSDLDAICARCLAREPADRYASCWALVSDLEDYLEQKPVSSPSPTRTAASAAPAAPRPRTARREPQERRLPRALLIGSAVMAVSISLGLLVGFLGWGQTAPHPEQSSLPPARTTPLVEKPPERRPLRWRLHSGQVLRYRFTMEEGSIGGPPTTRTVIDMRQYVTKVSDRACTLDSTIERFRGRLDSNTEFDSEDPVTAPLVAVFTNHTFQLRIDPVTGEFTVSGMPELPTMIRDFYGDQTSDILLGLGLDRLCHLLPGRAVREGDSWEVPERRVAISFLKGFGTLTAKLESASGPNEFVLSTRIDGVRWVESRARVIRSQHVGSATWRGGRLVRSEAVDEFTPAGSGGRTGLRVFLSYEVIDGRE